MKKLTLFCALAILCTLLFSGFDSSVTETPTDLTFGGLVSEETVLSAGHQRITEKYADVLNVVEYENNDGTRTVYFFTAPVKYMDEDGSVQRIDNSLTPALLNNSWKTSANWFDLSVSNDFTKGVTLSCNGDALTAAPVLSDGQAAFTRERDALLTKESLAFSNETETVTYTPTHTGYYINVSLQGGLPFALDMGGDIATAEVSGNRAVFTTTEGYTAAYSVAAYDVNGQPADTAGLQFAVTAVGKESYRLTVSSATTAQKVQSADLVIEATVAAPAANANTRSTTSDSTQINVYQDAPVYSNAPNSNYDTAIRCLVGVDGTLGKCRSYFKFNLSSISDIPYDRVLSAHFRLRELTGYDSSFQAVAYAIKGTWTEDEITWSNRPDCFDEKLCTVNVEWAGDLDGNNAAYYDFYITSAVMAWLQGIPNRGIMVKSRVEDGVNCRAFAAREYNSSAYMPRLTITYSTETESMDNIGITNYAEYYIKNKHSMLYLTANGSANGSTVTQKSFTGAAKQKWKVKTQSNGYYKLYPANAPDKVLDNCEGSSANNVAMKITTTGTSINANTSQQFKFIRNWDGSYQIVSRISNDARGLCAEDNNTNENGVIIQRSHSTNWVKSDDWTLEPVAKNGANLYCFTPSEKGDINTAVSTIPALDQLDEMDYEAQAYIDEPCQWAYSALSYTSIWIFAGHGMPSLIQFNDGNITAAPSENSSYAISQKPHNDLSMLTLAIYASCSTGLDDPANDSNMVGYTFQRGAHFTIAHSDVLGDEPADEWLFSFLEYCLQGQTIYEAMNNADNDLYSSSDWEGNANQRHVLGDNSLCLYHRE